MRCLQHWASDLGASFGDPDSGSLHVAVWLHFRHERSTGGSQPGLGAAGFLASPGETIAGDDVQNSESTDDHVWSAVCSGSETGALHEDRTSRDLLCPDPVDRGQQRCPDSGQRLSARSRSRTLRSHSISTLHVSDGQHLLYRVHHLGRDWRRTKFRSEITLPFSLLRPRGGSSATGHHVVHFKKTQMENHAIRLGSDPLCGHVARPTSLGDQLHLGYCGRVLLPILDAKASTGVVVEVQLCVGGSVGFRHDHEFDSDLLFVADAQEWSVGAGMVGEPGLRGDGGCPRITIQGDTRGGVCAPS